MAESSPYTVLSAKSYERSGVESCTLDLQVDHRRQVMINGGFQAKGSAQNGNLVDGPLVAAAIFLTLRLMAMAVAMTP